MKLWYRMYCGTPNPTGTAGGYYWPPLLLDSGGVVVVTVLLRTLLATTTPRARGPSSSRCLSVITE